MTEALETTQKFDVEIDYDLNHLVTLGDAKVVISPEGGVTVYKDKGAQKALIDAMEDKSLTQDAASVCVNGVKAELTAEGAVVIHTVKGKDINIKLAAAYETDRAAALAVLEIGAVMKNGTVYAGMSPTKNLPMFVAPEIAPDPLNFDDAETFANELEVSGAKGFCVPDIKELEVLHERSGIGKLAEIFNQSGSALGHYFRSSTADNDHAALCLKFSNGDEHRESKRLRSSVCGIRYS